VAIIGSALPFVKPQFFDNNGNPAAGYLLFAYEAGTSTKLNTYTTSALTVANTNPVVLDSAGRAAIFIKPQAYKIVLAPSTDTDPPTAAVWTVDNVSDTPSLNIDATVTTSGLAAAGSWYCLLAGYSGIWYPVDASQSKYSTGASAIGYCVSVVDATHAVMRLSGISNDTGLSPGSNYYISAVAGELTAACPLANVRLVGIANDAGGLVFPAPAGMPPWCALRTFGYSSGQANGAGSGDTHLTSFDVTIPADHLNGSGQTLVVEGLLAVAANANAKSLKLQVGGGTKVTVWSSAASVASHAVLFRAMIKYRQPTTGSIQGISWHGAAPTGAPTNYLFCGDITSVNWSVSQTLNVYAVGVDAADVRLCDYFVTTIRAMTGGTEV